MNLVMIGYILWAISATVEASPPTVDLGYSTYTGVNDPVLGVTSFFGIKYAQAPVGELRFRAPVAIDSNATFTSRAQAPINASAPGPACVQGTPGWQVGNSTPSPQPGSEDCLLLDVLVPQGPVTAGARLPVMVHIHGGGYVSRSAETYPGYALVNQSTGGLVFVAIQYRLGAFGWLAGTEVEADGALNAGLLDQRAALEWVRKYIVHFGGDASRVTVSGNSAGGGSAVNQMVMYGGVSDPPFRAVIAEYPWWQPYHDDDVLEDQYRQVLFASNCTDLKCLRSVDSRTLDLASQAALTAGYSARDYGYGDFYYGPSVDGDVIRDLPSNEFKQGHFTKVPVLVDRDGYEGYAFSNKSEKTSAEETTDLQSVFPRAKQSFFKRLYELYPSSAFNSTVFQRAQLFGDFIIDCPTYYMAAAVSDAGIPTWKMIFDAGSEVHGATVPFLFYTNATRINNSTLALIMKDYFLSFVTHLDPNVESFSTTPKPFWPQYNVGKDDGFTVMDVQYADMSPNRDLDASAQCDFFHGQSYVVRN